MLILNFVFSFPYVETLKIINEKEMRRVQFKTQLTKCQILMF